MIPRHRYGSVLATLDRAIGRQFARTDDCCSETGATDTAVFLEQSLKWLTAHLTKDLDPWRSPRLWRLDLSRQIPARGEKLLASEICGRLPGFYREIPAASGVVE